jgi:acyl carrier protein
VQRRPRGVLGLFQKAFPRTAVSEEETFVSLGGDSLSFVELSVNLGDHLGYLPENWQLLSIKEIERLPRKASLTHVIDTTVFFDLSGCWRS